MKKENNPAPAPVTELTLKLSIEETNVILESLGNLPYVKVYPLIQKIQEQANAQLG